MEGDFVMRRGFNEKILGRLYKNLRRSPYINIKLVNHYVIGILQKLQKRSFSLRISTTSKFVRLTGGILNSEEIYFS